MVIKMGGDYGRNEILRAAVGYTGTWFMSYLVFGSLTYLGGW